MDLEAILDGIESAGGEQLSKIEADAEFQVSQSNLKAREDASGQEKRILSDGRARLNREKALIEQQSVVRSLQIHADARQELIEAVLEKVRAGFEDFRARADYPKILAHLVNETLSALQPTLLEGQHLVIHFDARDKAQTAFLLKKADTPLEPKFDIQSAGGCMAETDDGQVSVRNTLESRFEQASAALQQKLSLFFEGKRISR